MLWVALVQEDYYNKRKFSHRSYLLYKIVERKGMFSFQISNTKNHLKVTKIAQHLNIIH